MSRELAALSGDASSRPLSTGAQASTFAPVTWVVEMARSTRFALKVLRAAAWPRYPGQIVPYAYAIGARSVLLVSVVTAFAGAMLALQGQSSLQQLGAPELLGMFVGLGGIREVFPVMAAGTVGARAGSAIAAELATMKTTDQIDALDVMAVDPIAYLVVPRFLAALLVTPPLMIVGTVAGLAGAYLTAVVQLGVDPGSYLERTFTPLSPFDLVAMLIKGLVFGGVIALVTAREGLRAAGGPAGVGTAANLAVVKAMIAGSLVNLLLSQVLFGGQG
ncbi:MAG: ABC transporter permease [Pseudomonadota bacterium]